MLTVSTTRLTALRNKQQKVAGTDVSATAFYIDRSYKRGFHAHCFAFLLAIRKPFKRINAVTGEIYRQKCQYLHSEKDVKKKQVHLYLPVFVALYQAFTNSFSSFSADFAARAFFSFTESTMRRIIATGIAPTRAHIMSTFVSNTAH